MKKKLIYINLDGFSYSYYEKFIKQSYSDLMQRVIDKSLFFTNLHSGLVSITNPMQSAILSGAWSDKTHNFYQSYDVVKGCVLKHNRTFDAQNIAQLFLQKGKRVLSIHQFMLENNPCVEGEKDNAYIKTQKQHSDYKDRFDILNDVILGNAVLSGNKQMVYEELPDFIALYVDDIDSLGHNNDYQQYPKRKQVEERQEDILERLQGIFTEIGKVIDNLIAKRLYEDTVVLLTTDHGMTPYFGKSKLGDLIEKLNEKGIITSTVDNRTSQTMVVALPYTIEVSLYATKELSAEQKSIIRQVCDGLPYVQRTFDKPTMQKDYGFYEIGPDFLVAPKYGYHFYKKDQSEEAYGASHDSQDDTSQHVFGLIFGGKVRIGNFDEQVFAIDLLPTLLEELYGWKMKDSYGKIFDCWIKK